MKKEAATHMLPTEDLTTIARHDGGKNSVKQGRLSYNHTPAKVKTWTNKHLYVTTDEEIKEGDWFIDTRFSNMMSPRQQRDDLYDHVIANCRKIIATTDPKLIEYEVRIFSIYDRVDSIGDTFVGTYKVKRDKIVFLPNGDIERVVTPGMKYKNDMFRFKLLSNYVKEIQQSFIEEYCKAGGIDKVLVEYELGYHDPDYRCNACDTGNQQLCLLNKLKVDSNNCIIIPPVEESLLEECLNAIEFLSDEANTNQYSELIKNIKENL